MSGWKYNQTLREIFAARWWGCPSIQYYNNLVKDERVQILAAYEADWRIKAVNNYEAQQEAERNAKRNSQKG